jgi:hypothetical protein
MWDSGTSHIPPEQEDSGVDLGTQFTCFTGTQVQIMTQRWT